MATATRLGHIGEAVHGKPYMWKHSTYGEVAVHVTGHSPNGLVAILSIDGGPDSTVANSFPALSDGIGYAVDGQLFSRPRRTTSDKPATVRSRKLVGGKLTNNSNVETI